MALMAWLWSGILGLIEVLFYWVLLPGMALTAWGFYLHRRDKNQSQSTLHATTGGGDTDGDERDSLALDDSSLNHWLDDKKFGSDRNTNGDNDRQNGERPDVPATPDSLDDDDDDHHRSKSITNESLPITGHNNNNGNKNAKPIVNGSTTANSNGGGATHHHTHAHTHHRPPKPPPKTGPVPSLDSKVAQLLMAVRAPSSAALLPSYHTSSTPAITTPLPAPSPMHATSTPQGSISVPPTPMIGHGTIQPTPGVMIGPPFPTPQTVRSNSANSVNSNDGERRNGDGNTDSNITSNSDDGTIWHKRTRSQLQELQVTPSTDDSDDKFVRLRSPPSSAPPPLSVSPGTEPAVSSSIIPPLTSLSMMNGHHKSLTMEQLLAERGHHHHHSVTGMGVSASSIPGSETFSELVTVISRAKAAGILDAQVDVLHQCIHGELAAGKLKHFQAEVLRRMMPSSSSLSLSPIPPSAASSSTGDGSSSSILSTLLHSSRPPLLHSASLSPLSPNSRSPLVPTISERSTSIDETQSRTTTLSSSSSSSRRRTRRDPIVLNGMTGSSVATASESSMTLSSSAASSPDSTTNNLGSPADDNKRNISGFPVVRPRGGSGGSNNVTLHTNRRATMGSLSSLSAVPLSSATSTSSSATTPTPSLLDTKIEYDEEYWRQWMNGANPWTRLMNTSITHGIRSPASPSSGKDEKSATTHGSTSPKDALVAAAEWLERGERIRADLLQSLSTIQLPTSNGSGVSVDASLIAADLRASLASISSRLRERIPNAAPPSSLANPVPSSLTLASSSSSSNATSPTGMVASLNTLVAMPSSSPFSSLASSSAASSLMVPVSRQISTAGPLASPTGSVSSRGSLSPPTSYAANGGGGPYSSLHPIGDGELLGASSLWQQHQLSSLSASSIPSAVMMTTSAISPLPPPPPLSVLSATTSAAPSSTTTLGMPTLPLSHLTIDPLPLVTSQSNTSMNGSNGNGSASSSAAATPSASSSRGKSYQLAALSANVTPAILNGSSSSSGGSGSGNNNNNGNVSSTSTTTSSFSSSSSSSSLTATAPAAITNGGSTSTTVGAAAVPRFHRTPILNSRRDTWMGPISIPPPSSLQASQSSTLPMNQPILFTSLTERSKDRDKDRDRDSNTGASNDGSAPTPTTIPTTTRLPSRSPSPVLSSLSVNNGSNGSVMPAIYDD